MWLTDNPDKTLTVTEDGSNHMSERRRYLCIQDVKREKNE
jgi:hypothetical protein